MLSPFMRGNCCGSGIMVPRAVILLRILVSPQDRVPPLLQGLPQSQSRHEGRAHLMSTSNLRSNEGATPAPRASGPQRRRLLDRPRPAVGLESRCCGVISLDRDGVRNALVLARDRRGEGTLG